MDESYVNRAAEVPRYKVRYSSVLPFPLCPFSVTFLALFCLFFPSRLDRMISQIRLECWLWLFQIE